MKRRRHAPFCDEGAGGKRPRKVAETAKRTHVAILANRMQFKRAICGRSVREHSKRVAAPPCSRHFHFFVKIHEIPESHKNVTISQQSTEIQAATLSLLQWSSLPLFENVAVHQSAFSLSFAGVAQQRA